MRRFRAQGRGGSGGYGRHGCPQGRCSGVQIQGHAADARAARGADPYSAAVIFSNPPSSWPCSGWEGPNRSSSRRRPPVDKPTKNDSSSDKSSSDRRENKEEPSGAQPRRAESDHCRAGLVVEATTRPWIARWWRKEIVGTRVVPRFGGQLAVVTFFGGNAVSSARKQHRADDRVRGRTPHPNPTRPLPSPPP